MPVRMDTNLKDNAEFHAACKQASEVVGKKVLPTIRQLKKFKNKIGLAYTFGRDQRIEAA